MIEKKPYPTYKKYDPGIAAAIAGAGGVRKLARLLGIFPGAVIKWPRIPTRRIIEIERKTGVPREKLRPDLYR